MAYTVGGANRCYPKCGPRTLSEHYILRFVVVPTGIEPVASSVSRKRSPTELIARGGSGNRTRVQGFAGPCLSHSANPPGSLSGPVAAEPPKRADDGIRTRDPHLGKVMRYQLRYVRVPSDLPATEANFSPPVPGVTNRIPGASPVAQARTTSTADRTISSIMA